MQGLPGTMKDEKLRREFGVRLEGLRKQKGWGQKELAQKLGVQLSIFNKYECGLHVPPIEKLIELAEFLDTTVDYLVTANQADTKPISSKRLMERFRVLEQFANADQETIIRLVDAFIVQHKMAQAMNQFPGSEEA